MEKLTIQDAALKLGISKEAIHNRIRRGSLESIVEDDVKFVIINEKTTVTKKRTTTNRQALNSNDKRYYKLLEEQNEKLQNKVETLEVETRSLRDQKEQMLIDERKKIEQIYNDKDEQLKSILSSFTLPMIGTSSSLNKQSKAPILYTLCFSETANVGSFCKGRAPPPTSDSSSATLTSINPESSWSLENKLSALFFILSRG